MQSVTSHSKLKKYTFNYFLSNSPVTLNMGHGNQNWCDCVKPSGSYASAKISLKTASDKIPTQKKFLLSPDGSTVANFTFFTMVSGTPETCQSFTLNTCQTH